MGEDDTTSVHEILPDDLNDHDRLLRTGELVKNHDRIIRQMQRDLRWALRKILGIIIAAILGGVLVKYGPTVTVSTSQPSPAGTAHSSTPSLSPPSPDSH